MSDVRYIPPRWWVYVHDASARLSFGLPGLSWVALRWGEPLLPWWGPPHHRGHAWWGGWGGPRIVNNVVIKQTTIINERDIHFHNATLPRAILTLPADKFGRERIHATVEERYRPTDFAPVRGELPVKPLRACVFGGAPKGVQPPREIVARPVVSTRAPRERALPMMDAAPRASKQAVPDAHYVIPPARRAEGARSWLRPPPPRPPRYDEVRRAATPPAATPSRSEATTREVSAPARPAQPAAGAPPPTARRPASSPAVARSQNTSREPATVRSETTSREQRAGHTTR